MQPYQSSNAPTTAIEGALSALERARFRDLEKVLQGVAYFGDLPKKTRSLSSNLLKELFGSLEPRTTVITVHLYFDYILGRLLERNGANATKMENQSFYKRLQQLKQGPLISSSLIDQLQGLNSLRNKFAHNLFFDLADWDPRVFPWITPVYQRTPKARKYRRLKHLLLFKIAMMKLLEDVHQKHAWLSLEDVPKGR